MTSPTPGAGGQRVSPTPTRTDHVRAHAVVVDWLRKTPAMDAQIRTGVAQFALEELMAAALAEVREENV